MRSGMSFSPATRYAILTTLRADGSPVAVPVWYGWDGRSVEDVHSRLDAEDQANSPRPARHLCWWRTPSANWKPGSPSTATVAVHDEGGLELASQSRGQVLAEVDNPERAATLDEWRQIGDRLAVA